MPPATHGPRASSRPTPPWHGVESSTRGRSMRLALQIALVRLPAIDDRVLLARCKVRHHLISGPCGPTLLRAEARPYQHASLQALPADSIDLLVTAGDIQPLEPPAFIQ